VTFEELVEFWRVEVTGGRRFRPYRCWRRISRKETNHYLFWFRLGQYFSRRPPDLINYPRLAKRIQVALVTRHNMDISLEADIGIGLKIMHRVGVVITGRAKIGQNFVVRQNTTIGIVGREVGVIQIGDNVNLGANVCIIGDHLNIGDNVIIGAMALVTKDVPSNSCYYCQTVPVIRSREAPCP
jgi:serine O-acetyltransferase